MSTRAKIGILLEGGAVKSITLWHDGYPNYAGQMLAKHYKTAELIHDLMVEGDLNELEAISESCNYSGHSRPIVYGSLTSFLNDHSGMDYIYIFSEQTGWQYIVSHR